MPSSKWCRHRATADLDNQLAPEMRQLALQQLLVSPKPRPPLFNGRGNISYGIGLRWRRISVSHSNHRKSLQMKL